MTASPLFFMSRTGNAVYSSSIAAARCRMEITVSTSCLSASALSIAQLSIVSSVHDPVDFFPFFFLLPRFFFFRLWIWPCSLDMGFAAFCAPPCCIRGLPDCCPSRNTARHGRRRSGMWGRRIRCSPGLSLWNVFAMFLSGRAMSEHVT